MQTGRGGDRQSRDRRQRRLRWVEYEVSRWSRELGRQRGGRWGQWDRQTRTRGTNPWKVREAQRCSGPTGRNRAQRWKECSQGVRRDRETGQDQGLSGLPKGIRTPLGLSFCWTNYLIEKWKKILKTHYLVGKKCPSSPGLLAALRWCWRPGPRLGLTLLGSRILEEVSCDQELTLSTLMEFLQDQLKSTMNTLQKVHHPLR